MHRSFSRSLMCLAVTLGSSVIVAALPACSDSSAGIKMATRPGDAPSSGTTTDGTNGDGTGGEATPPDPALEAPKTYAPLPGPWTLAFVQDLVTKDAATRGADASYFKYTYVPQQFLDSKDSTNLARIGITKAMNSVAIEAEDILPLEDVGGYGLVFAIDLRKYLSGDSLRKWTLIAAGQPFNLVEGGHQDVTEPMRLAAFDANAPVPADRLAYNVIQGGIYVDLIDTPIRRWDLETTLGVGDRTETAAFLNAITLGARYTERREFTYTYKDGHTRKGFVRTAFDPFDATTISDDTRLVWKDAGGRIPKFDEHGTLVDYVSSTVSEVYASMKNGLFSWYIFGEQGQRRSTAERRFVIDPLQRDDSHQPYGVTPGFCASCHVSGIQGHATAMWNDAPSSLTNADAQAFWTKPTDVAPTVNADKAIYKDALKKIVLASSDASAAFNQTIVDGVDPREPMYFLMHVIAKDSGNTEGLTRRGEDGVIPRLAAVEAGNDVPYVPAATPSGATGSVDFEKTIRPILASTAPGKVYDCMGCHQDKYGDPAKITRSDIDKIVLRVTAKTMPAMGTTADGKTRNWVTADDIATLTRWRDATP